MGFLGGGEEDGVGAAVLLDAGGGGELDVCESAGPELAREEVPVEAEVGYAVVVRVEGAVFSIQVGQGDVSAGGEEREKDTEEMVHVADVMKGHGGGDEIVGSGGRGIRCKVGLQVNDIEKGACLGFLGEDVEHAIRRVDGGEAADERGEGEGEQTGAAAVVEGGETGLEGDLFFKGRKNVGGEPDTGGIFVPCAGACVKGVAHAGAL